MPAQDVAKELDELGLLGKTPEKAVASETPKATSAEAPPRDPDTGRFVPAPEPSDQQNPAKPTHPQYLIDAAAYFGFSEEETNDLPTEQLNAMVWRMNRAVEKARKEDALQRTIQDSQVRVAPEVAAQQTQPQDEFAELESEGIHPLIIQRMRAMHDENKALKGKVGEFDQREARREAISNADIFDEAFEGLGKDFEKFFGAGSGLEMQKADPNFKRRMAIIQNAGMTNEDSPRVKKNKIQKAAKEMFGPAIQPAAADEYNRIPDGKPAQVKVNGKKPATPRITEQQWNDGALAVPTHREVDELPNGDEKAVRNLAKKLNAETSNIEDAEIKSGLLK